MRISETKKCAVLAPPVDSYEQCRCTELQKERGILRFLGFSQPSPRCRFHITADSKPRRRRRHAPSVLQPCSHPKRTVLYQILLTQNKVMRFDPEGMLR
ncbi:hypothetical protein OYC64_013228 [Pagothenia borchgrevinki]|uniref:Uncharacterized protein n=1 Tax=Pagothenia borchgrevinki TaxID=8213 RepID=A0ABD2FVG9_PAGBO